VPKPKTVCTRASKRNATGHCGRWRSFLALFSPQRETGNATQSSRSSARPPHSESPRGTEPELNTRGPCTRAPSPTAPSALEASHRPLPATGAYVHRRHKRGEKGGKQMRRRLARPGSSRGGGDRWPTSSEPTARAAVVPSRRRCRGDPGRKTSRFGVQGPSTAAGSQHRRRRRRAAATPLAPSSDEGTGGGRGGGPPCSPWICHAGAGGRATVLEAAAPPLLKAAGEEDLRASMAGSSIYTWIRCGPLALRLQARGDGRPCEEAASSGGRGGASSLLRPVTAAALVSPPLGARRRRGDAEMDAGVGGELGRREREWREGDEKSMTRGARIW
jgi:hypothetical protein